MDIAGERCGARSAAGNLCVQLKPCHFHGFGTPGEFSAVQSERARLGAEANRRRREALKAAAKGKTLRLKSPKDVRLLMEIEVQAARDCGDYGRLSHIASICRAALSAIDITKLRTENKELRALIRELKPELRKVVAVK